MSKSVANARLRTYVIGYILSVILTVEAYLLVVRHTLTNPILISLIIGLALVQMAVQLVFFLHLGSEPKPRWNVIVFLFAAMVVSILVLGSLWIMYNLNYNHVHTHNQTPQDTNTYIIKDEGIQP